MYETGTKTLGLKTIISGSQEVFSHVWVQIPNAQATKVTQALKKLRLRCFLPIE